MVTKVPLDQLAKDRNLLIEWKAFELRPEEDERPEVTPQMAAKATAAIASISKKYGIPMVWNPKTKHSRRALEGAKFAEEQGLGHEYHGALFSAQYQETLDIDNIDTLVMIAERLGLDPVAFRKVIEDRKYQDAVLRDCDEAMDLGIELIPTFFYNDRRTAGVKNYKALARLIDGK